MDKIDKAKRTLEKVYFSLWSDWLMILFFIFFGIMGMWTSLELNRWCQITELSISKIHLGKLIANSGYTRVKKSGFISWIDIGTSKEISPDDQIQTEEDSSAYLELSDQTEIRILAKSFLAIHSQKSKTTPYKNQLESIRSYINSPIKTDYNLELITGGIEIRFRPNQKELEVVIGDNKILTKQGNRLLVSQQGPILSNLESSKMNENEPSKETRAKPLTPIILAPLSGSHYLSTTTEPLEIALHWRKLPFGLNPEIELSRLDDPDFETTPLASRSGALLRLPDGQYRWKVRTISKDNQKSDWSQVYQFSIQEYMRGIKSVISIDMDVAPF